MNDLLINRTSRRGLARRLIAGATLFTFVATPHYAMAALTDVSNAPISSAATTTVPPNVLFILDASGSMDGEFMPDEMGSYAGKASYASHVCNTIYYNPAVKYLVPKNANGTDFANATFTAADNDGFLNTGNTGNPSNLAAGSTTNLTNGYKGTNLGGSEKAFYYKWNGAAAPTTAQCQDGSNNNNASRSASHTSGNGNWTKVQIPAAEEENFANWFTYYRTRMLLMKTAAGRAFNGLNDNFRVGFITICPNGSSCDSDTAVVPVTSNYYLKIDAFAPGHKAAWYTKFYQQEPSSFTPLRQALARAGRHFAGKTDGINAGMNDDPIQYSCQQNYAILTTDGYWNYGRGKTLTNGNSGTGDIGNNDNNSGVSPRPMLDSGPVSTVVTQEYYADVRAPGANGCSATNRRADRYTRTVTTPQTGSATTSGWSQDTNNVCYPIATIDAATTGGCMSTGGGPSGSTAGCVVGTPTTSAAGSTTNTLADVAAYYYQTDLRGPGSLGALGTDVGTSNNVPPSGSGVEDDNATHQHMTTFTLGLGLDGQLKFDENYKSQTTGDFADLRGGAKGWPNPNPSSANTSNTAEQQARIDDLWHAAVNGRGTYFSAKNPVSLTLSLTTALTQIQSRLSSAAAAATSTLEPTTGDNLIILPTYTTQEWTGELTAFQIDVTIGSPTFGQLLPGAIWSARTKLNGRTSAACDTRTIKLFSKSATAVDNMVDFTWNTKACDGAGVPTGAATTGLSTAEQEFFNATGTATPDEVQDLTQFGTMTDGTSGTADQKTAARGENLVNFLRGHRGKEGYVPNDINKLYRARKHVLGDIVNSQPLYVRKAAFSYNDTGYSAFAATVASRAPMAYVAANDGMLHAFNATADSAGGEEAWAFMPRAVLPRLYKLADSNYAQLHEYYVDGRPIRDDVYDKYTGAWKTILVGGLNKGGRGYYALDVTNPTSPKALWEFTHDPAVCAGAVGTGSETGDCHLGYTFGNPVISKLTDGTWVVFVTSGYNNVNTPAQAGDGQGYLYVLDAIKGTILYKIRAGDGTPAFGDASNPSGLAKITAWVNDSAHNNTTLRVYGGDLLGNIWRFDVNDQLDALGLPVLPPAGREATRIATLKDSGSNPQPITVALRLAEVGSPPVPYIYAATGKYLGTTDTGTTQTQSIYAIKDPLTTTAYTDLRTGTLKRLTMTTSGTDRFVNCDTANASANCSSTNGWYVDLPEPGERVNVSMELQLGTLVVASNVPANTACEPGGFGFLNYFDFQTGFSPAGSTARSGFRVTGLTVGLSIVRLPDGSIVVYRQKHTGEPPGKEAVPISAGSPSGKRLTWRELMQ